MGLDRMSSNMFEKNLVTLTLRICLSMFLKMSWRVCLCYRKYRRNIKRNKAAEEAEEWKILKNSLKTSFLAGMKYTWRETIRMDWSLSPILKMKLTRTLTLNSSKITWMISRSLRRWCQDSNSSSTNTSLTNCHLSRSPNFTVPTNFIIHPMTNSKRSSKNPKPRINNFCSSRGSSNLKLMGKSTLLKAQGLVLMLKTDSSKRNDLNRFV